MGGVWQISHIRQSKVLVFVINDCGTLGKNQENNHNCTLRIEWERTKKHLRSFNIAFYVLIENMRNMKSYDHWDLRYCTCTEGLIFWHCVNITCFVIRSSKRKFTVLCKLRGFLMNSLQMDRTDTQFNGI